MPFLTEVRASPKPRPKRIIIKGAEEHADFVLSRNLARENPLSTSACPARKSAPIHFIPRIKGGARGFIPTAAPRHGPHIETACSRPQTPSKRSRRPRKHFQQRDYRKKGTVSGIYKSVEGLSCENLRTWNDSCCYSGNPRQVFENGATRPRRFF
jgi:hypothetical protein